MKKIIYYIWYKIIGFPFRLLPLKNNRIVLENYFGKGYGDNPKYIANELLKSSKKYDLIWLVKGNYYEDVPKEIKQIKRGTLSELYYISTAKIWIDNSRKTYGITKRNNQFYIQTWHSSLRLKKIEKDAEEYLNPNYILACKNDSKMINIIISGCKFSTDIYKNSFWYDGEIIECGTPRCDLFFNEEKKKNLRKEICKLYNINQEKINILYAPTFRNNKNESECYMNAKKLKELLGDKYNILVRLHPISKYKLPEVDGVVNATEYNDMQELLCACDYLITDYSGCCFDMMINNKPCILFTKDKDDYLSKERELYFNFEDLPFIDVKTEKQLANTIKNFDINSYNKKIEIFKNKICLFEKGNSSKTIVKIINKVIDGDKNEKI